MNEESFLPVRTGALCRRRICIMRDLLSDRSSGAVNYKGTAVLNL